ncbi:folate-binding protein YgfZ [Schaalia sp. ZJ1691]|uniref:CAF17-like 4Fe-4S cluster assembly/insertion protein YgfZ n=1 Tax=Schaalia sp. ZJ1691 TaxID=2709404 RepID=UPI0013EC386F|nr:folate-binding protein YgfZ [Schaalia sp. ZJ1691]
MSENRESPVFEGPAQAQPAAHFGDPIGEQWALEAGRALVDRCDLRVIAVSGPDRQTWLTSITSQVITGMGPSDSRELLILSPEGRIEHAAAVLDDGSTTLLITEGARADGLIDFLESMRFALRVDVELRSDLTVYGSVRPRPSSGTKDSLIDEDEPGSPVCAEIAVWDDPWPGPTDGGAEYFRGTHPGLATPMRLHLVDASRGKEFEEDWLSRAPKRLRAGMLAWEAMRIAAWRPRVGIDTDERTIPHEVDWLRTAVHTDKGCYRGQETVARVVNLGRPPRRFVYLQLDGMRSDLPEPGTQITLENRVVGRVTSVARHADQGPIALALVARNLPADTVFVIDGVAAAQELIVPIDGKSSISPQRRPGLGLSNPDLRRVDTHVRAGSGSLGAR